MTEPRTGGFWSYIGWPTRLLLGLATVVSAVLTPRGQHPVLLLSATVVVIVFLLFLKARKFFYARAERAARLSIKRRQERQLERRRKQL